MPLAGRRGDYGRTLATHLRAVVEQRVRRDRGWSDLWSQHFADAEESIDMLTMAGLFIAEARLAELGAKKVTQRGDVIRTSP